MGRDEHTPLVTVREENGRFLITATGEMDLTEDDLFAAAWAEAHERALPVTVVDLSGVSFADSALLNSLLDARKHHAATGRTLVLAGPLRPAVTRLLELTGTLGHFTVTTSLAEALR
ncbi:STAS domain-containing protein [Streptomyces sp. CRN 30]|uniref:STAS domain-containing protein n=1 Tax=Streptomyces sp. CRN 30 TaxID=3075613 RepID=UPI002A82B427|nr:STAS domain-containing protein [Streptomyces sp. CRN 30]